MKIWVFPLLVFTGVVQAAPPTTTLHFREPHPTSYRVEDQELAAGRSWMVAVPENSPTNQVILGDRMVLQVQKGSKLQNVIARRPLSIARKITDTVFILQASDAPTSAKQADQLARLPGVISCQPLMKREVEFDAAYAPMPDDYWFTVQAYLENRNLDGSALGADLNVRSGWAHTRGAGVTIAIGDDGMEVNHPDLVDRTGGAPHFNFEIDQPSGLHPRDSAAHGTCVAGLAAATANNRIGITGVAPEARLASWVVIGTNQTLSSRQFLVDDESLLDMFQYQSNVVQVQNHSWHFRSKALNPMPLLADIGISNAIAFGRNGLGTVIVRAAGNDVGRQLGYSANDHGMAADPRVITVAATKYTGRVASYSNPGANVLVAAVGRDSDYFLPTTDRQGLLGFGQLEGGKSPYQSYFDTNAWNYFLHFEGTSAAAPQIAGLSALLLSANPTLSHRDVKHILIHSARHYDKTDPGLVVNGAGFAASHNVGFGIPDAGEAVRLAKIWSNRPSLTTITKTQNVVTVIPDAGLRVVVAGANVPPALTSIIAFPGLGPHADSLTASLPLVDVGLVTNTVTMNLTNKGALIQHRTEQNFNYFTDEITKVAQAGAAFAVIFYYSDSVPSAMTDTFFAPIPAVLIPQTYGLGIRQYLQTNGTATGQIVLNAANYNFNVSETLSCEHVGVRVSLNHPIRADLRVTVKSPQGTVSVLQPVNGDTNSAPTDWTFWSTHHFYESSSGTWTVSVSDEFPGATGTAQSVDLIIRGVTISDSDADGLDDGWETAHFESLAFGPKHDPDQDGYSNAREHIIGTNPNQPVPLKLDLARLKPTVTRVSWPGNTNFNYAVWAGQNLESLSVITNLPGKFPETEWVAPFTNRYFVRVVATPIP